jgi:hypothetical protein
VEVFLNGDLDRLVRVEVLESLCEFVGVVEDVSDRWGHGAHLMNFRHAGMARTTSMLSLVARQFLGRFVVRPTAEATVARRSRPRRDVEE